MPEQLFRALRAGLTDGPMGKPLVVERVRSLQLHIKDIDKTRFDRYTNDLYKATAETTEPVTEEVEAAKAV
jgi:hypothetical protein